MSTSLSGLRLYTFWMSLPDSVPNPAEDSFTPPPEPTEEEGRRALHEHLRLRARAVREKYGGQINSETMIRILCDPDAVRYPTTLQFNREVLQPGEFAVPQPIGGDSSEGYALFLHPFFKDKLGSWPPLVAYHIPTINYGPAVTADEAELFGSELLGMGVDAYYNLVCELADRMMDSENRSDGR